MTSCNEEVLLQVPQVGYKNTEGTLYLMDRRIVWKADNEDTDNASISHLYCHIKSQQVSSKDMERVLLRVVLHSKDSSTFVFLNRAGVRYQTKDMRQVKALLFAKLKECKQEAEKILKDKHKFLVSHPDRLQLYRNLVVPNIIASEEFWLNQAAKCDWVQEEQPPEIGVSSDFLSEIKRVPTNYSKYIIDCRTIESIFKVYPSIKNLHTKHVPDNLTEEQFWMKFIFSFYFQKNGKYLVSEDYLFAECSKIEDEEIKKALLDEIIDPSLDVASFEDKCPYEGYGLQSEYSNNSPSSQTLIGRINRQSIMVCRGSSDSGKRKNQEQISNIGKKQKFFDNMFFQNIERYYLHGPRPEVAPEIIKPDDVISATIEILREAEQWQHLRRTPSSSILSPEAASEALFELTQKNIPVKSRPAVPRRLKKEIKILYLTLSELLNQFWKCFPVTTRQLEEKAYRMHAALTRFQSIKLKPFEDKLKAQSCPSVHNPMKHVNQLLEAANQKFNWWQELRSTQLVFLR